MQSQVTEPGIAWAPNRLPMVYLSCGCQTIPWPIIKIFGRNIEYIICDIHGPGMTIRKHEVSYVSAVLPLEPPF